MLTMGLSRYRQLRKLSLPKRSSLLRRAVSQVCLKHVLQEHRNTYDRFYPEVDTIQTQFLKSLAKAKKETILGVLDVLRLASPVASEEEETTLKFIYIRTFYNDLLTEIRKYRRTILIGNPGIGKSWFQYYYIARITQPELFESELPVDCYGLSTPPSVIIRQIADQKMLVYFVKEREVHRINSTHMSIIECFAPKSSLYLFEPGKTKIEPHYEELSIPTLETVSPDIIRYKEFRKRAMKLYIPVWSLDEIKSIGQVLRDNNRFSPGLTIDYYKDDKIEDRYKEFGGILRYVFPIAPEKLAEVRKERKEELEKANLQYILTLDGNIEDKYISHLLVQYKEVKEAFKDTISDFVNQNIVNELLKQISKVSIREKASILKKNDDCPSYMQDACSKIYETLICDILQNKQYNWYKRDVLKSSKPTEDEEPNWEPLEDFSITKCIEGTVPTFKEMESNIAYYSLNTIFPAVDIVVKHKDKLVCIQVTRQQSKGKVIEKSALEKFLKIVGVKEEEVDKIRLVLCPRPGNANVAKIVFHGFNKAVLDYEVWRLPTYYIEEMKPVEGNEAKVDCIVHQ
eukprot:TRINITY_DN6291_c0_g1_i1.p1 TRINITY_DN6291_c0_g1~~TRINITY_DN6291_c0_g1_i1.p1  ORF type:complete len:571 (-),score=72.83 TRINITY_DN6291_c0_g1_i1:50-1762(-)